MRTIVKVDHLEFHEGGKAIWVHASNGSTVLRIQCTGVIATHSGCVNDVPHADINVVGNIDICIPDQPKRGKRPVKARRAAWVQ